MARVDEEEEEVDLHVDPTHGSGLDQVGGMS